MSKNPLKGRSPGNTAISVSMPKDLVASIDAAAAADSRTRSQWIRLQLEQLTADLPRELAASEPAQAPYNPLFTPTPAHIANPAQSAKYHARKKKRA